MQLGEEKLDGKLRCTDPGIVITTTSRSLAGVICLGVLIVELTSDDPASARAEMPIVNSTLYGYFKQIRVAPSLLYPQEGTYFNCGISGQKALDGLIHEIHGTGQI